MMCSSLLWFLDNVLFLVQPAVTHLPTIGQSEANSEKTNQELVPDTLDPTTGYKYPSLGTTSTVGISFRGWLVFIFGLYNLLILL